MNNQTFKQMCKRAKEEPHIAHRGRHGLRILAVFEDSLNRESPVVPADGKGKLHFYVINGSHRNLDVTLDSHVVFGVMRFTQPNASVCRIPALSKDTGKPRERIAIEGALGVCKEENADAPQEIFTTVPRIKRIEVRSGEEVETHWKELRNIIWTSSPAGAPAGEAERPAPADAAPPSEAISTARGPSTAPPPAARDGRPSTVPGGDLKRLQEAIMSAYTTSGALRQMVYFTFKVELNLITKDSDLPEMVFNVIRWAEREGRMGELLGAVPGHGERVPLKEAP